MSEINGPITITIEILGTHDTETVAMVLGEIGVTLAVRLPDANYMVDCDWGKN